MAATAANKTPSVLVCVTGQKDCARLIDAGAHIAKQLGGIPVHVLNVQPSSAGYDTDGEELEYLRQRARLVPAEMTVFFDDNAVLITAGFIKQTGAVHIVTGMAGTTSGGYIELLHKLVPHIPISMVGIDRTVYNILPSGVLDTAK